MYLGNVSRSSAMSEKYLEIRFLQTTLMGKLYLVTDFLPLLEGLIIKQIFITFMANVNVLQNA